MSGYAEGASVNTRRGWIPGRCVLVCAAVAFGTACSVQIAGFTDGAVPAADGAVAASDSGAAVADASRPDGSSTAPDGGAVGLDGGGVGLDAAPPVGDAGGDPLDPALEPPVDTDPGHYPTNVWVTDGMAKVHPDAAPGALHWALLEAAKNEFESFQVHVKATGAPIQLSVTVSDLTDARSGAQVAAASNVVVYREAYLNITTRSDANGTLGLTPDPLVPAVDPYLHQARNAFPVTVPVGETRSAWIDVLVPQSAPSGWYLGTATVKDGATTLATLPVRLAVWDFAMPSTATLRSGFGLGWNSLCVQAYGGYAACGAYPGAGGDADKATELTHLAQATMFLDHRVSLGDVVYAPVTGSDFTHFDFVYSGVLTGTAGTMLPGATYCK